MVHINKIIANYNQAKKNKRKPVKFTTHLNLKISKI